MVFQRRPGLAILCALALLLVIPPCHADTAAPLTVGDLQLDPAPAGSPTIEALPATPPVVTPDSVPLVPSAPVNDTPPAEEATAQDIQGADNGTNATQIPAEATPRDFTVRGTVYFSSPEGRQAWADGHLQVYVNGIPAAMNGPEYSVALSAADGDPLEVILEHDCGYQLARATGRVDLSQGSAAIDIEAPALEISGDVYADDLPAGGACVFVYLNDRPFGPIEAGPGPGPMFSLSIPGGHPGDHVSITASKDDRSGFVSQDLSGYCAFLTVNLKGPAVYLASQASPSPAVAGQAVKNERLRLKILYRHSQLDGL